MSVVTEAATGRAEAAIKGAAFTRIETDDGGVAFIVSQGAYCKTFRRLDDARRFVQTLPRLPTR